MTGGGRRSSSTKAGRVGRGGGSGITGMRCSSARAASFSAQTGVSWTGAMRGGGSTALGRCGSWSRLALARTMFDSTTMSVGPPIINRCSMLSRRTNTSRLRPSMGAASITARRGMRPRFVLAPRRLPANRRTSQAATTIRASTATNAKIKVTACMLCPRPARRYPGFRRFPAARKPQTTPETGTNP